MVDRYVIEGGIRLKGEVRVGGSKNATLPIMAAALLTERVCFVENIPIIDDIETMGKILTHLGCRVSIDRDGHQVEIDPIGIDKRDVPPDLATRIRASYLVAGPLLARFGAADFPQPGGDPIGNRRVDVALDGFEALGAEVIRGVGPHCSFVVRRRKDRLAGNEVYLDYPAHTATENLLMAACLAQGTTHFRNACPEPEIVDLSEFLRRMGVKIRGEGTPYIVVEGRSKLYGAGHSVIPDRIEAGTFAVAAAITGGDVLLRDVNVEHMMPLTHKLRQAGIDVTEDARRQTYRVRSQQPLRQVEVQTLIYPGFPTDLQTVFTTLLTQAAPTAAQPGEHRSVVHERVSERRWGYIPGLLKMGADITVDGRSVVGLTPSEIEGQKALVRGPTHLHGASVVAEDIRAGAALILAGLVAEGTTEVLDRAGHIGRGYERIEEKLRGLGANIERIVVQG